MWSKSHYGKTNDMIDFVQVTGGGNCTIAAARDAMGIEWMNKGELNEAIPPAYTKHIGKQLKAHLVEMEAAQEAIGWKALVIWECETNDEAQIEKKLQRFLGN